MVKRVGGNGKEVLILGGEERLVDCGGEVVLCNDQWDQRDQKNPGMFSRNCSDVLGEGTGQP